MTDELDNRERAKGVPPKMVIKNRPIVKMPAPEKAKSSPILLKILVGYGEQCYYDGYIEESNIAQAEQAIQALIDREVLRGKREEVLEIVSWGSKGQDRAIKRLAELNKQIGDSDDR